MVKRIPVIDVTYSKHIKKMLVLKRDKIEVRTIKALHTKLEYIIDPKTIGYAFGRYDSFGRKSFSIIRNNPYPWILGVKHEHFSIFRIDSEKNKTILEEYIWLIRAVS